ncbi:MAG: GNAT family N-acetyltransferase [Propionibacteriaceae bacterium]|nr:GNAT family N-acetyltransferase [Propionibacteriaceae bacterium]
MPTVRALGPRDLTQALALAGQHPVENVLVLAKMRASGLEPHLMGHDILGAFDFRGRLLGLLSNAASLTPVELAADAIPPLARYLGGLRRAGSIVGARPYAMGLFEELARRFPGVWGGPREVRERQPVLMIDRDPDGPADPAVTPITAALADAYYRAAVAMYTEEIGVTPAEATGGYRRHVDRIIQRGDAYGVWDGHQVLFKADVSVASGPVCQIGGVWLHPDLRGRGLSEAALAAVIRLVRRRYPIVSLYVNDYNQRALSVYRRLGFTMVGEFATVLW